MTTRIGQLTTSYSARGIASYSLELWHDELSKHRLIRGKDPAVIIKKAALQGQEWDNRWDVANERDRNRTEKNDNKMYQEDQKELAVERTTEAQEELKQLTTLLTTALKNESPFSWENLMDRTVFSEDKPVMPTLPLEPRKDHIRPKPNAMDSAYQPTFGFLDKIFSSRKLRIIEEKKSRYSHDCAEWARSCEQINERHGRMLQSHHASIEAAVLQHTLDVGAWEIRKNEFLNAQSIVNTDIERKRFQYLAMDADAVAEFCENILMESPYPDFFIKTIDLEYVPDTKLLIIDYHLPSPDDIPRVKSVKYVASRDDFEEQFLTDAQVAKLYDDVLYQVVLRTAFELFSSDAPRFLETIAINGIVCSIDRSTGMDVVACILSLRVHQDDFMSINLAQVDLKQCFKTLKGVGSSKLHGLAPVPPIMTLSRDDRRFVSGYDVANTLDESVNLAAMHWEDFEHLIRELFEKEFSSTGGEVRITQASRDAGVDAIAFDPDPIRGGKIVIQAKRYTNTVGVSAVRDLFGTVHNEGATKGVLVTTSDFGPDSYAFANGKPLVLISGANLLHMLEKHGHKARINLAEAKQIAANEYN